MTDYEAPRDFPAEVDESANLRAAMVRKIVASGHATNPAVRSALELLRIEVFQPDRPLSDLYHAQRDVPGVYNGRSIDPLVIAAMLDQLDVRPGNKILHIGTGTGYTAALLAEIAGPDRVVTVDRSNNITIGARAALRAHGYDQVEVITGEGNDGAPGHGPFDRVIVTASSYDLPETWVHQLAPGGRLVVPLRFRGFERSVAFTLQDGVLRARDSQPSRLPRMLGANHDLPRTSPIGPRGQLVLTWDHDLAQVVTGHKLGEPERYTNTVVAWSDVVVRDDDPLGRLWLHLAATERTVFGLSTQQPTTMMPDLAFPEATPAIIANETIAYLTRREIPADDDGTPRYTLGAAGVGLISARLSAVLVDRIQQWALHREAHPTITAYPADATELPPGQCIRRPSCSLLVRAGAPN
ncbi:methyltransferase domain-containing protein [Amycolatopsis australiensis]|uniref:Protein-L-isoaspartate O-methyltransferase n=1 Tax=Amycolatopsis australiensis TaxID=546364 RepID=A0A1K1LSI0_9PSEU|nr:methyltransferase domain-containing protein [Amycolatopsis australiensis]SFW13818.1 protein-L-isoaspartate(D-aspartate) O-methyltransferase [Amycolatopsis australiensis]